MPKVRFQNRVEELEVKQSLLDNLLRLKMAIKFGCRSGSCGKCRCRLVEGKIRELRDHSYVLNETEQAAGIILACQSVAQSDVTIELIN